MVVKKAGLRALTNAVTVVGMGMSPDDLSSKTLSMLEAADILIGGKRHLSYFMKLPAKKVPLSKDLKPILRSITTSLKRGKRVVVIASGDPGYYGIAQYLVSRLGKEKVEIIPNITTFQVAFAKIKESWDDAFLLSLHGRPAPPLAPLVRRHKKVGILIDNTNTPQRIAKRILSEDRSLNAVDVFILEELGTEKERIHKSSLKSIGTKSFSSLSVMILIARARGTQKEEEKIFLGIPDIRFTHQRGLITKDDVRIFTLAKLNLLRRGVFWDIGSGSGSVAIEVALLAPELEVFAIEKYEERIGYIKKNIQKFSASGTITPVLGEAPRILKGLPKPERIFIGGSEGKLLSILRYCRRALLPPGKVVINAATLETVNSAVAFFDKAGWSSAVTLLNISQMKKIGNQKRFQPLNPIFIIEGSKTEVGGELDEKGE